MDAKPPCAIFGDGDPPIQTILGVNRSGTHSVSDVFGYYIYIFHIQFKILHIPYTIIPFGYIYIYIYVYSIFTHTHIYSYIMLYIPWT